VQRPDALILSQRVKRGADVFERVASVADIAEPILGADRTQGLLVYIRPQPDGTFFITRDPNDSIYFATQHPRAGQNRYRWEDQSDGSRWGYLVEGAQCSTK
jgi:hypothetical protein